MLVFVFLFLSLFYTLREASLQSAKICAFSWVFSFLAFLLSIIASLPDYLNFFLSVPVWICDFFDFHFEFSTLSCYFHHPVYFFLGVYVWSYRFLWRLLQRTACIWYVRARTSFFMFGLRCRCASVIMCATLCLFDFFCRGIFLLPLTPELLEPVLRPRTTLCCGDELMWEQQQLS